MNSAESNKFQDKKDYFYQVAMEEFQKLGFDQTSMRHLAKTADVSLGNFYYYYPSKEAIIMQFYEQSFQQMEKALPEIMTSSRNFTSAYIKLIQNRIDCFAEQRDFVISISRMALDPNSPLSPFAGDSPSGIREKTVKVIEDLIQHYKLPVEKRLKPFMPHLLWFYMMGVILFWFFDRSLEQRKTDVLVHKLTPHIIRIIKASAYAAPINTPLVKILRAIYNKES